eukprot:403361578
MELTLQDEIKLDTHELTNSLPINILVQLLKYLEIKDILLKFLPLNKLTKQLVQQQNYVMFKHFLKQMHMSNRLKRSTIPAHTNLLQLIQENFSRRINHFSENLLPYAFQTDGGTYNLDYYYFVQNIFSRSSICYSTSVPKNANVQAYIGQLVSNQVLSLQPKNYVVKHTNNNEIKMPYLQHLDENDEEQFKVVTELVIHNIASGYTCLASCYMLFFSDKEVKLSKSDVLKFFAEINTIEKFEALGLPIANQTNSPGNTVNRAYEIDLSNKSLLQQKLKLNKFDCFPLLFVISNPSPTEYTVQFKQKIAAKYMVLQLIDSHKNNLSDNNIDMYNLTLNGYKLQIPPPNYSSQLKSNM